MQVMAAQKIRRYRQPYEELATFKEKDLTLAIAVKLVAELKGNYQM